MQQNPAVELTIADVPIGVSQGWRQTAGRLLIVVASLLLATFFALQLLKTFGLASVGFDNWRPVAITFVGWAVCLCASIVWTRGQRGEQAVFLLPAVLITFAFVIFPTFYALFMAFHNWNLSAAAGRQFTGLDNFRGLFGDRAFWVAMQNMVYYSAAVLAQYIIAYGLAILLNQQVRGRKFFRVVFLLPFMLSPVAVSFMIGKTLLNSQYGPVVPALHWLGIADISFYENPWLARLNIMIMDAWYSIPFMLPISLTAIILRVIFELKLIDVVRVVTGGGPGGATDTVSLFIYREGIQKTNVGFASAMSEFYLLIIIISVTIVLWLANKWVRKVT